MGGQDAETNSLLVAARERGNSMVGSAVIPPGLDQFAVYTGLIASALELGTILATEKRDLEAIDSHHKIEMARIRTAFREVEIAMLAGFKQDESLREKTFEMIKMLIVAGQFEVASEFHKRMIDSFQRPALEAIIEHRNIIASQSGSYIHVKRR